MSETNEETGRKLREFGVRLRFGLALNSTPTAENRKKRQQIVEDAVREKFEKGAGATQKRPDNFSE